MKKILLTLLIAGVTSLAIADIQAPPRSEHTPLRKLGRGIGNLLYGISELPQTMITTNKREGNNAAWSVGVVEGVYRSLYRMGYGAFEIVSFPVRTYKGSFLPPYQNIEYDPYHGFDEFPPEIGFQSKYNYSRGLDY